MRWIRSSRRGVSAFALSGVLLTLGVSGAAQGPSSIDASAPRVTIGGLALLVATDPAKGVPLLGDVMTHPAPGMRAVAARIAGVGQHTAFAGHLVAALDRETDRYVAAEQVRALSLLGTPEAAAAVDAHLPSAGQPALMAYALWLGRMQPARLIEQLPHLVARLGREDVRHLVPAVVMATYQHPAQREPLLRAWLYAAPPDAWRNALATLGAQEGAPNVSVLQEALSSANDDVRRHTVWAVVRWLTARQRVPDALLDAARSSSAQDSTLTWEALGREMVGRYRQRNALRTDRSAFLRASLADQRSYATALRDLPVLTAAERRVVEDVAGPPPFQLAASPQSREAGRHAVLQRLRTVESVWPGFLQNLLAETECELTAEDWRYGTLRLTYDVSGRPIDARVDRTELPPACVRALGAIAVVELADPDSPVAAKDQQVLMLFPSSSFVSCADGPRWERGGPVNVSDLISEPRRISGPVPRFPRVLVGTQGTVFMAGVIDGNGCVRSAGVLRGTSTAFDLEALRTVVQWRYEPARLNGVVVPVDLVARIDFNRQ